MDIVKKRIIVEEEDLTVCKSCKQDLKLFRNFSEESHNHMAVCNNWNCRLYRSPARYVPVRYNDDNLTDKEILSDTRLRVAMKNIAAERDSSSESKQSQPVIS